MPSAASPPVGRVRTLVALTKPRIVELLLATALPTCFLAAHGLPPLWPTVAVLVGGSLAAGSANTFNSVYDRDIDAVMPRTHNRPAARGQVSAATAVVQGFVLGLGSVVVLVFMANLLSALLAIAAIAFYAVGYTMLLKRRTPQNIVWGGAAGCMPVLIVFLWTPPHYWPLAIKYRDEYAAAGVPMLPVVRPLPDTAKQIIWYSWAMVAASLALIPVGGMGWLYGAGAVVLGAAFIVLAYRLRSSLADPDKTLAAAMRLFHGSISYLALLFLLVAVDPFLH